MFTVVKNKADKVTSGGSNPVIPLLRRQTTFKNNDKTKMQLSWKNITIIAPPKKNMCKKPDPEAKGTTILSM